ncbi:MAG: prepilin-type N-terminal cleavage/methylation domain-containing protein [Chthonomonas sp.]|nr:prepilin-type N-terminal cleavage/methylation domain-containing protein [Chthonomonas sp.]
MKKAFTLIELLVVIAIIAILAAILFPVFTQAKAAAKKTAALSNAKQNALSVQLYIGDNDENYPQSAYILPTAPRQMVSVYDALQPYSKNKDIFGDPGDPKAINWKDILATKLAALGGPFVSPAGITFAGLGINFALFEDPGIPGGATDLDVVRNEGGLPLPAETVMFYSADYTNAGQLNKWATKYPSFGTGTTAYLASYRQPTTPFDRANFAGSPRHNGQLIVNYADGHAKAVNGNGKLPGTGINQNTTSTALVDCYNLPFDLNGIPDLVGEPSLVPQQ